MSWARHHFPYFDSEFRQRWGDKIPSSQTGLPFFLLFFPFLPRMAKAFRGDISCLLSQEKHDDGYDFYARHEKRETGRHILTRAIIARHIDMREKKEDRLSATLEILRGSKWTYQWYMDRGMRMSIEMYLMHNVVPRE